MTKQTDTVILQMALGYALEQRNRIDALIVEMKHRLKIKDTIGTDTKRTMSPAARKSIAAAQKKRWHKFHAAQKTETAPTPIATTKRQLSRKQLKAMRANAVKARAAQAKRKSA